VYVTTAGGNGWDVCRWFILYWYCFMCQVYCCWMCCHHTTLGDFNFWLSLSLAKVRT